MFTGVKMSAEEEIHRGAMRVLCELGSYKRMLYTARKSRKQLAKVQVNNRILTITGYCCIHPQMLIILAL